MKVFIMANGGFSLRADGVFLGSFKGKTGLEAPPCFLEILPHTPTGNIGFYLDHNIKSCHLFTVYDLGDALLLRLKPPRQTDRIFSVCYQQRHADCGALVTVFKDGVTRIVVETPRFMETLDVPSGFDDFSSASHNGLLAVYSQATPHYLAVFSLINDLAPIFTDVVEEFEITPVFRTKTRYFDLERTTALREFTADTDGVKTAGLKLQRQNEYTCGRGEVFLKHAFFERLALGLDITDLLSPSLRELADKLKEYLGDFTDVLPDFCTKKGVRLAYNGKGIRPTKLFDLIIKDGLVDNIIEL